jgi:gluconolactonase
MAARGDELIIRSLRTLSPFSLLVLACAAPTATVPGQQARVDGAGSGVADRGPMPDRAEAGVVDVAAGRLDGAGDDAAAAPDHVRMAGRFVCPPGPFPAPVAGPAQAVCTDFTFKYDWNEGPTWVAAENAFFFTNFVVSAAGPGDIIKYTPGGQCETFMADVGCNGLSATYDGTLAAACQTPRAVVEYDVTGKRPARILANSYLGQMLDSPNDIVTHSNGSIYFTNPTYELGGRLQGIGPAIFRIDPSGMLVLIAQVLHQPNGIALSPDEKRLYVVGGGVWDLDAAGVPSNRRQDFPLDADGISVDCAGNVYLSGGTIVSPNGQTVGTFPGGTMAAFGGADNQTLIVVGGTQVSVLHMNLPGPTH